MYAFGVMTVGAGIKVVLKVVQRFGAVVTVGVDTVSHPNFQLEKSVELSSKALVYYNRQRNSRVAMIVFGTLGVGLISLGAVQHANGQEGAALLYGLGAVSVGMTLPLGIKSRRNLRRCIEVDGGIAEE